jgi:hypothetical protein
MFTLFFVDILCPEFYMKWAIRGPSGKYLSILNINRTGRVALM